MLLHCIQFCKMLLKHSLVGSVHQCPTVYSLEIHRLIVGGNIIYWLIRLWQSNVLPLQSGCHLKQHSGNLSSLTHSEMNKQYVTCHEAWEAFFILVPLEDTARFPGLKCWREEDGRKMFSLKQPIHTNQRALLFKTATSPLHCTVFITWFGFCLPHSLTYKSATFVKRCT